jgi:hypothetical protein
MLALASASASASASQTRAAHWPQPPQDAPAPSAAQKMALPNQLINTPEDQNEIPRAGMSLMARPQLRKRWTAVQPSGC